MLQENDVQAFRVKQVAKMLSVPISTLYDWVRRGEIASVHVGKGRRGVVLIPTVAIDEFLMKRSVN